MAFKRSYLRLELKLASLLAALVLLLSLAAWVLGQVNNGARAGDSSELERLDSDASSQDGPALISAGVSSAMERQADGGLWLSGDTAEAFAHLRWIAGRRARGALEATPAGRVSINAKALARGLGLSAGNDSLNRKRVASFVASDEGLLLLAQAIAGPHRYLLHIGATAPTLGGQVNVHDALNLDNRYDSRINPRRRTGQKLNSERPPEGFDVVIAINPAVGWFNINSKKLMPAAQVVFHELAEAHARLALGLDYLPSGDGPGAHQVALDRETILERQRAGQYVIKPVGANLVLASSDDWTRLMAWLRDPKKNESPMLY